MINSNTFSNFNSKYPIYADLHTHSISSGHGSEDTITDMIRCASESGLSLFGISDHGPATSSSAKPSYLLLFLISHIPPSNYSYPIFFLFISGMADPYFIILPSYY